MRANKFAELRVFVGVVDAGGGMSEVACRLGISRSAVSQRIQPVEKRLNACLLERSPKLQVALSVCQ
jgi:DNA-binding transcriptional LysR family regulator